MLDFFAGGAPALAFWVLAVVVLGGALIYGIMRTGWLNSRERAVLDANTRMRQRSEDPQKTSEVPR